MSAAKKIAVSRVNAPITDATENSLGHATSFGSLEILTAATDDGFKHICQTDGHHYEDEVLAGRRLALDLNLFLRNPFEIALGANYRLGFEFEYTTSMVKMDILNQLMSYLKAQRVNGSLSTSVLNCADELYTNSIYNAPVVNRLTQFNPGISRSENSVFLSPKRAVQIAIASKDDRLALMCRDPFGSLDVETFLRRIKTTHEVGPGQALHFGAGGAGLGSYIIFNESSSLYIAVDPGIATVITCVFPTGMSGLARQILAKHLHWATAVKG